MKTNSELYYNLISTIKKYIPSGEYPANWIARKLKIEKESAYRRLRGEVLFTFDEIAKISSALGFSVDQIIDSGNSRHALFDFPLINVQYNLETYRERIVTYANFYQEMAEKEGKLRMAINEMPFMFTFNSEILSRFRLYKWFYQLIRNSPHDSLSEFVLTDSVMQAQKQFMDSCKNIPWLVIILDRNVFSSMVRDIEYFYKRKLVTEDELQQMKSELLLCVDQLERMATQGHFGGGKIDIYLTSIDLEATYAHMEHNSKSMAMVKTYSIADLISYNIDVCNTQKEWIDSLRTFSVLVSQSAEIQRFNYMNKQRQYINEMGSRTHMEELDF